jgi:hypothetical protein
MRNGSLFASFCFEAKKNRSETGAPYALPVVHAGHDVVNDVKTTVARHVVQLPHNSPISRDNSLLQ